MGWQDAPVVAATPDPKKKPAWADAPVVDSRYAASMKAPDSLLDRIGTGMRDPIEGAAQLLEHLTPGPVARALNSANNWVADNTGMLARVPEGGMDEVEQKREADIQASRGGATGTDWARVAGNIASPVNLVPMSVLGKAAMAARPLMAGAVIGATSGATQPVTDIHERKLSDLITGTQPSGSFWGEKAQQTGIGAAAGGVLGVVADQAVKALAPVVAPLVDYIGGVTRLKNTPAQQEILRRIAQDTKGGGPTAQDMLDLMKGAGDAPLTLADVAGENVRGLAGRIARKPGEGKQVLTNALTERDEGAGMRLNAIVDRDLASGSMKGTFDTMVKSRSAAAREPWAKAMEGGSLAPLEQQFTNVFDNASRAEKEAAEAFARARAQQTVMAAQTSRAGENVYASSAAARARQFADDQAAEAQKTFEAAQAQKATALARLRQAQADGTAKTKGAVWSPRIQQFLDDPIVKAGISHGLKLERLEALAEGRAMNPSEYAIVGTDPNGEPIVGAVPNMKLLAAAKEGLDRILDAPSMRNELTGKLTKEGIAVDKVRRAFLSELDAHNPDYAVARQQWSGATQSMEALKNGRDHFKLSPEEAAEAFSKLTPNDQEFYKLGVADKIKEMIGKTGFAGDESKAIVKNQRMKDQLRPLFADDAAYERFMQSVGAERQMAATKYDILGNSRTASRLAEDQSPESAAFEKAGNAALHMTHGNYIGALKNIAESFSYMRATGDPARNAEMARILVSTGPNSPAMRMLQGALANNRTGNALAQMQRYARPAAPFFAPAANAIVQPPQGQR